MNAFYEPLPSLIAPPFWPRGIISNAGRLRSSSFFLRSTVIATLLVTPPFSPLFNKKSTVASFPQTRSPPFRRLGCCLIKKSASLFLGKGLGPVSAHHDRKATPPPLFSFTVAPSGRSRSYFFFSRATPLSAKEYASLPLQGPCPLTDVVFFPSSLISPARGSVFFPFLLLSSG